MLQQLLSLVTTTDNMVSIEGTYTSVKDQSFVDFLIHLGNYLCNFYRKDKCNIGLLIQTLKLPNNATIAF
jgi:hypothetical protein